MLGHAGGIALKEKTILRPDDFIRNGQGCGFGNQSSPIARCSLEHESPEYCFQCPEYPCERYEHIDQFDSFITHMNQKVSSCNVVYDVVDSYKFLLEKVMR